MHNKDLINHTKVFFLTFNNIEQRHQYANSLASKISEYLFKLENAFIKYGVDNASIEIMLNLYGLNEFTQEVRQIQIDFYLRVYEIANKFPHDEDNLSLVDARNPSYLLLVNKEIFERELETVLRYKNREETIRQKVTAFEQKRRNLELTVNTSGQTIGRSKSVFTIIRPLIRYASIAVAASLILLIWQPFHESNHDLFNQYINIDEQIELPGINSIDGSTRGLTNSSLEELNEIEKYKVAEAFKLFKNKDYIAAAKLFDSIRISATKGSQFLIYLAISQLHSNNNEKARANLITLLNQKNKTYSDDARFYLSLYYIKVDNRSKAKDQLRTLATKRGKYKAKATHILDKMRWF